MPGIYIFYHEDPVCDSIFSFLTANFLKGKSLQIYLHGCQFMVNPRRLPSFPGILLGSPWVPYYGAPRSYWSIFSVINCRPFIHSKRRRKIHNSEEFCVLCNDCSRLESHCELLLCRSFELHSWFPPPASMPEMAHCEKSRENLFKKSDSPSKYFLISD